MFLPTSGGAVALQYEQKEFLNNITVTVHLASGKNLPLKGTGQSAEVLHFAGKGAVAALTVSEQNGVLALYISGHLQRDCAKGRFFDSAEQNLSEKAAVTVAFSAPVGLEAYHSLYSIGFWNKPGAYGAGPFAFYSKGEPKNILLNGRKAPCKKQGELYIIEVTSPNSL